MHRSELTRAAQRHGLDLIGYTSSERVEARAVSGQKPSDISEYLAGFIVVAKRIPAGLSGAADGEPKPLALAMVHRALETAAARLAYELESRDFLAVVVPPLAMDFEDTTELSLTPAGQGSPLIRTAAVAAGLGTAGLNRMVLTPEFGPRVFFSALMTSLELEPDRPLTEELCPGLESCGRCAAVCPAKAIPTLAVRGQELEQVRDLDEAACARLSQPHGVGAFTDRVRRLVRSADHREAHELIDDGPTALLWYHMTFLRQGVFSSCTRCLQVCPVGSDYESLQRSPIRRADLPADFEPRNKDNTVTVEWLGGAGSAKERI